MKHQTHTNIADTLLLCAAVGLAVAWFFSGMWSLQKCLLICAAPFGLALVAAWVRPPFWWGNRTFTTPVNDPTHEAKHVQDTQQAYSIAPQRRG